MSASIYGVKQWCTLTPEKITETVNKVKTGFIYKGEDFYREVEKLDGWRDVAPGEVDDSVLIWNSDDYGPVNIDGEVFGLFVHFNDDENQYDWACTYLSD